MKRKMMIWKMFALTSSDAAPSVRFVGRGRVLVHHRCPRDPALWRGLLQAAEDERSTMSQTVSESMPSQVLLVAHNSSYR